MQRVATISAGSGAASPTSLSLVGDAASSAAAGSLSALSGPARVTFSNMVSVSSSSNNNNDNNHSSSSSSSSGGGGASLPTSPRWGGSHCNNSTVATTSSGTIHGLLRNSSDGIPSLERMSSLDSLGGGSLDSNGAPSLGIPPMPALSRNHSLSLPQSARNPPSMQRVASDASISSVEGLARIPTMMRLSSEPTMDPDQPLTISRAVSMDAAYFGGGVYVESPGTGRLLPGSLSMGAVLQQQHQQQQQFQHNSHVQQQQWSQRSPEDMLVSLRGTPRTPRGYGNVNIASTKSARSSSKGARAASAAKPTKRKANGANNKKNTKKGSFVCDFTDPATKACCGQSFDRKAALTAHRREHSGDRPYKCKVAGCNKTFATASNRTAHQRSTAHTSERKYKCDFVDPKTGIKCTNAYTHSRSLIEHKCKHTGTWLHQCKDCGKKFTVNSNFKRHRDKVDCKAKLEKKRLREAKEKEKKARQAARAALKSASAGVAGGDAKRSRRSQAI